MTWVHTITSRLIYIVITYTYIHILWLCMVQLTFIRRLFVIQCVIPLRNSKSEYLLQGPTCILKYENDQFRIPEVENKLLTATEFL